MTEKIKAQDLCRAIAKAAEEFQHATDEEVAEAINEVALQAAKIVQNVAQIVYPQSYTKDIKAVKAKEGRKRGEIKGYVSASDHYRVAHLLEHGHALKRGGRTLGRVLGNEHFAQGELYIDRNYPETLKRRLGK